MFLFAIIPPIHWAPTRSQSPCQVLGCVDVRAPAIKRPPVKWSRIASSRNSSNLSAIHCVMYLNFVDIKIWKTMLIYFRINKIR